jgi:hypothetical protein
MADQQGVLTVLAGSLPAMTVDPRFEASLYAFQHGVLSRAQALSLMGLTAASLRHRIRPGGPWQRLLPGVYLTTTGVPTWEQLQVGALLYAGWDALITGPAALRHYKIGAPDGTSVDVLVPASQNRSSRGYVVIHRTRRMPKCWAPDLPLRYAPPARAVADTVRRMTDLPDARAVVASAVQQRLCAVDLLAAELADGPIRGSALLRSVLAEVADGIRSAPEGDLRDLIIKAGLPMPLFNRTLYAGGRFLARPDAWWPQAGVVAEVDSRQWHATPEGWERTMERHNRLVAAGLGVLHFSPRELRTEPDLVVQRIAAALRAGRPVAGITTGMAAA